jgi:hypothetical protein
VDWVPEVTVEEGLSRASEWIHQQLNDRSEAESDLPQCVQSTGARV